MKSLGVFLLRTRLSIQLLLPKIVPVKNTLLLYVKSAKSGGAQAIVSTGKYNEQESDAPWIYVNKIISHGISHPPTNLMLAITYTFEHADDGESRLEDTTINIEKLQKLHQPLFRNMVNTEKLPRSIPYARWRTF